MQNATKFYTAGISVVPGERAIIAKISTIDVDRDGEVLMPMGCWTKDFEKSGTVFINHKYGVRDVFGKCVQLSRTDNEIVAKTVPAARPDNYPADQEWLPDTIFSLFEQGVLKGFSIGAEYVEGRPAKDYDVQRFGPECKRVISKWKLLEFSVAPLPCNQSAVAMAVSKGLVTRETAEKMFGEVAEVLENAEVEDITETEAPDTTGKHVEEAKNVTVTEIPAPAVVETPVVTPKRVQMEVEVAPEPEKPAISPRKVVILVDSEPEIDVKQLAADAIAKRRGRIYLA